MPLIECQHITQSTREVEAENRREGLIDWKQRRMIYDSEEASWQQKVYGQISSPVNITDMYAKIFDCIQIHQIRG